MSRNRFLVYLGMWSTGIPLMINFGYNILPLWLSIPFCFIASFGTVYFMRDFTKETSNDIDAQRLRS